MLCTEMRCAAALRIESVQRSFQEGKAQCGLAVPSITSLLNLLKFRDNAVQEIDEYVKRIIDSLHAGYFGSGSVLQICSLCHLQVFCVWMCLEAFGCAAYSDGISRKVKCSPGKFVPGRNFPSPCKGGPPAFRLHAFAPLPPPLHGGTSAQRAHSAHMTGII